MTNTICQNHVNQTFKRYEIKYFVTPAQYDILLPELTKHMVLDTYCTNDKGYMLYNLYYDTVSDDIVRMSLGKPYYKEKLRMRAYSQPDSDNVQVFLELKKKIGGIVAKRRAVLNYSDALDFMNGIEIPEPRLYTDSQVLNEIADFRKRFDVKPKMYISYERVAYFDRHNSEFRVSFDKNVLTRKNHLSLSGGDFGNELLPDGMILMEIKCDGAMPLWLSKKLSELKLYSTSFSKYGTAYKYYSAIEAAHTTEVLRRLRQTGTEQQIDDTLSRAFGKLRHAV